VELHLPGKKQKNTVGSALRLMYRYNRLVINRINTTHMEITTIQQRTYTLFGKEVEPGTLLYSLCDKYYAKFGMLEKDIETEKDNERRNLMRDIEEGVWFCEFRSDDVNLRREVMLENFYETAQELPI